MDEQHTKEEMEACLERMRAVSGTFYLGAVNTGNHAFIEFCGFMNEYIMVCQDSMAAGIDFMDANTHSGNALAMHQFRARYLAEKFDCIFGPALKSNEEAKEAFRVALEF